MTINQQILDIVANTSTQEVASLVTEWCNASTVEIDEAGNIWIAQPQTGHWLSDDAKTKFVTWCKDQ